MTSFVPVASRPMAARASLLALPLLALAGATTARAGGFGLHEQSSYYQGTSFAGDAAGGAGLASQFWNPAAMAFTPGLAVEQNITYIAPHASIDVYSATAPVTGTSLGNLGVGDMVDNGWVPTGFATYGINDKWVLGLGMTSPFGLITDAPCNWSGRYYGCYSRIFDVNVQGSIAYKVNEWLTLGAGVNVNYIDARLSNAQYGGPPPANNLYAVVNGDDMDVGYNLGVLFTFAPGTTLGVGYRSGIGHTLSGDLAVSVANILTVQQSVATADLDLPGQVSASFRSQLNPQWTVMGTVEWTNWSSVQQLEVKALGTVPVSTINMSWNDGWYFSGGVEYQWDPKLALRAGLAYELTPVPDETRSPRLPDTNRLWLSGGFTYNFTPQLAMDFAYSHIFGEDSPINLYPTDPANATRGSLVGEVNNGYVDIVSLAVRYKFDAPIQTALITK